MAARSKAWVCGRSPAGIVDWNPTGGMDVCCECCVLSGRGLCVELVTRPEESYRLCCVVVCDLETSRIGAPYIHDISHLRVKIFVCRPFECAAPGGRTPRPHPLAHAPANGRGLDCPFRYQYFVAKNRQYIFKDNTSSALLNKLRET